MKKMLFLTLFLVAVPSFFILKIYKEDNISVLKENIQESNDIKIKQSINIKVKQVSKNKIITIDLEDYVRGVIAGEMPIYFTDEALKAQAVAARTYALRRINENNIYDVVDTTSNQVYKDDDTLKLQWKDKYEEYITRLNNIVTSTSGEYVSYNGEYADTLFFSTSVGSTENSEEIFGTKVSYLRSVSSNWDEEVSPVFEEKTTFTRDEFCNKLQINDCSIINVSTINETSTGRIKSVNINGKIFTGSEVAYKLGVRSNYFYITIDNGNVLVITRGFGHGVGMSQYGAEGMSKNGYTYREILSHYYQGTEIKNIY